MRLPSGDSMQVHYSPSKMFAAHVQIASDVESHESWVDLKSSPVVYEKTVRLAIVPASPSVLNVVNGAWNVTVSPGGYRDADGNSRKRIDVTVAPLAAAFTGRVAPHGLIGQSLHDRIVIQGKLDEYVPDAVGEYTTSAQGDGAIEGGPFSTEFKFSRYATAAADPRDVALLQGQKTALPASQKVLAAAQGDVAQADAQAM